MDKLERLMASAELGLRTSYRDRAHLPGSPWYAYLGLYGGVVVARADNLEEQIPDLWRPICRIDNAASDGANLAKIRDALATMPIYGEAT